MIAVALLLLERVQPVKSPVSKPPLTMSWVAALAGAARPSARARSTVRMMGSPVAIVTCPS
ncbi:hypothetical protein IP88_13530 [alpha proteobacterium AAP81b]|nr:hypothetical protein IP88_13530 [alpha proteobacterium AAP81b]